MKKSLLLLLFVLVLSIATACGTDQDSQYGMGDEDQSGLQPVKNDGERDVRENTNQNPNFIDLSDSQPTKGTDIEKARQVLEQYTDYEADEVWINGQQMWVTAHTKEKMTEEQRNKEEAKLNKQLTRALPRYKLNVQIKER
ncbi:hypothetical protein [Bacillus seohaeanensis]|jgi:hypothetical protein|uniref:Sporulation protein n=1 Tax=Bacillus seohaeanensis TaxID=284580 RepID=A0ABW5RRR7_9BACI